MCAGHAGSAGPDIPEHEALLEAEMVRHAQQQPPVLPYALGNDTFADPPVSGHSGSGTVWTDLPMLHLE